MDTRFRFKFIALLIILSLAGLVAFQGYWLKGLYDSLYIQMENNIKEALRIADYQELFIRIHQIKEKENTVGKATRNIGLSLGHADTLVFSKRNSSDTLSLKYKSGSDRSIRYKEEEFHSVDSTLTQYFHIMNQLENYVQREIHSQIDSIEPISYNLYYIRLKQELQKRGITAETELTVNYQETEKVKATMVLGKNRRSVGMTHSVNLIQTDINALDSLESPRYYSWKNAIYFDYPIQSENNQYFRLYLKSPTQAVLSQMRGILVSSISLLILIILAFIYMLRIILRQKTVEELKSDFTNNMTHELKTPISISYSAIDALLNFNEAVNDKQRKYLTIVREQLIRLTALVEQILTLTIENRNTFRLHLEPIKLVSVADSLIQQYKLKTRREIEIISHIPSTLLITADRTHLYNMLSNLIDNAIKYTPHDPCRITLQAEVIGQQQVCISVSDNGMGIHESHQKHIFDKFYRVPNGNLHNVKGYGLGLYYVKDMVERHGGTIRVKSEPRKGTTFTLCFKI